MRPPTYDAAAMMSIAVTSDAITALALPYADTIMSSMLRPTKSSAKTVFCVIAPPTKAVTSDSSTPAP